MYAELHCKSNYTFLTGASHPEELVFQAKEQGYQAIALTDECTLSGVVKAYKAAKECGIHLIIGSEFLISSGQRIVALAPNREAYSELSGFISLARRRSSKGSYEAHFDDLRFRLRHCVVIWLADADVLLGKHKEKYTQADQLSSAFGQRLYIGVNHCLNGSDKERFVAWKGISEAYDIPMVACGSVLMHQPNRKYLLDAVTALRYKTTVQNIGSLCCSNSEAYLKSLTNIHRLYPDSLLINTIEISEKCHFSLSELKYQYPKELVPNGKTAIAYLRSLVEKGKQYRWPNQAPDRVSNILEKELKLIEELHYEYYFLTVYDIVLYARTKGILCQGRGSAANSVVCYCLKITEISPDLINVLFERFISKERDEPPDIDVDFESGRREEVIQYIYSKYGRERAALAATIITYKPRSAIRDVGKALGFDLALIDRLAKSLVWWDRKGDLQARMEEAGMQKDNPLIHIFYDLVNTILGFPRHLSQHVGGFVITQDRISDIVPTENASMPDRTVIQWDKEDLEEMGLMKVDVLSLGMLSAIRKALSYIHCYHPSIKSIADIPKEDSETYAMLSRADSVGVFQVESRAQMSMLPRLNPKKFYDLVIQIAIVRPGPIQGGMVHPYLKRRNNLEEVTYYNDELKEVLGQTLGVPIFQEQAIRLAMVAAGFSGGEADQLRRAMASWGKNGNLLSFQDRFIKGMLKNGYPKEFADRVFEQIKGFGGYGFPESHSASFALLCYYSSWIKCHHPAAFYCALLNSQPMGFYSPSQLIQDARRHSITVLPIDINLSEYECILENINNNDAPHWAIRMGFNYVKTLAVDTAKMIPARRSSVPFSDVEDLRSRTELKQGELQILASAEVLHSLLGHRYQARWAVSGLEPDATLLSEWDNTKNTDTLTTNAPALEDDICTDVSTMGVNLRPHIMALLRRQAPFSGCKQQSELMHIRHGAFVKVSGLVTGRQRPGTAKGTVFLTLEDETGNINVVVWRRTQDTFRKALLCAKLVVIKGRVEKEGVVVHVTAGQILDYSDRLKEFDTKSRDFH